MLYSAVDSTCGLCCYCSIAECLPEKQDGVRLMTCQGVVLRVRLGTWCYDT